VKLLAVESLDRESGGTSERLIDPLHVVAVVVT
jgi:hypothetical protein